MRPAQAFALGFLIWGNPPAINVTAGAMAPADDHV